MVARFVAHGLDSLGTWIVTPKLELENNPLMRRGPAVFPNPPGVLSLSQPSEIWCGAKNETPLPEGLLKNGTHGDGRFPSTQGTREGP